MSELKYVAVICGNQLEFKSFVQHALTEGAKTNARYTHDRLIIDDICYFYPSSPENMRGMNLLNIVFYGTFINLKNLSDFENEAHSRMLP